MTLALRVFFERRAAREVEDIDGWWRVNRTAAPDLFMVELEQSVSIIQAAPALGAPARSVRLPGVRRVLMRRTRYHLYYRVVGDRLDVLAVWHTSRGAGPDL